MVPGKKGHTKRSGSARKGSKKVTSPQSCEEQGVQESCINSLPDEVLLTIYQYFEMSTLCCSSSVCRHWYNLLSDQTLAKKRLGDILISQEIPIVPSRGDNVEYIREYEHHILDNVKGIREGVRRLKYEGAETRGIVAASLDCLISELLSDNKEKNLQRQFLYTFPCYITAHLLLMKLLERYDPTLMNVKEFLSRYGTTGPEEATTPATPTPTDNAPTTPDASTNTPAPPTDGEELFLFDEPEFKAGEFGVRWNVCKLIAEWLRMFPEDFDAWMLRVLEVFMRAAILPDFYQAQHEQQQPTDQPTQSQQQPQQQQSSQQQEQSDEGKNTKGIRKRPSFPLLRNKEKGKEKEKEKEKENKEKEMEEAISFCQAVEKMGELLAGWRDVTAKNRRVPYPSKRHMKLMRRASKEKGSKKATLESHRREFLEQLCNAHMDRGLTVVPVKEGGGDIWEYTVVEIARQMTLLHHHLLCSVGPREFLNRNWRRNPNMAPHLCTFVDNFNQISGWVAHSVITPTTPKERSVIIKKLLKLIVHLEELGNYNGAVAVISGLSSSSVSRLRHTIALINKKHMKLWKSFSKFTSANHDYLRQEMKNKQPPLIPFTGIFVYDLNMLEDSVPNSNEEGMINFRKRREQSLVIETFQSYKRHVFDFPMVAALQSLLLRMPVLPGPASYDLSLLREPRKNEIKG